MPASPASPASLIGHSLSGCVKDLSNGTIFDMKVAKPFTLSQVSTILSGTACRSDKDFHDLCNYYAGFVWQQNTELAISTAWILWREGRILQWRTGDVPPERQPMPLWTVRCSGTLFQTAEARKLAVLEHSNI